MKIISGGQTGVDRAALDAAISLGLEHGGWCPQGRRAEDGVIPPRYRLQETASSEYEERTRRNIADADATIIFTATPELYGGTKLTLDHAQATGRPILVVRPHRNTAEAAAEIRQFISHHQVKILNVAGPRESEAPDLHSSVTEILKLALRPGPD